MTITRMRQIISVPRKTVLTFVLFSAAIAFAESVAGQTLTVEQLKNAADAKGCESIPLSSERRECNAIQDAIERCKDARDSRDPADELKTKKKTFKDIQKNVNKVKVLEKQKENDKKKLKDEPATLAVVLNDLDNDIAKLLKKNDELKTEQENHENDLDLPKLIDNANRCFNYRAAMREHFDKVVEMLEDRKSFPSDAAAKKEVAGHADKIVEHIQSEVKDHRVQEDAWKNRAAGWQKVLDLKE